MFTDSVKLTLKSGKGGAGAVSFRREKFVIKGGPDGGDGGKGGDVYIEVDENTHTLSHLKGKNVLKAGNGRPGEGRKKYGKKGESIIIKVPPGTQIIDDKTGEVLLDMLKDSKKTLFLEGGKGGLGNWHFRSSTNQRPTYAQPGLPGVEKEVRFELKLIADVGLVGFPNVGKSTLISRVSNATPQIANYEFTTLTPKLGVVSLDEMKSFVMADIPGIIEGASDGRGLGLKFLKHIERTKFLLFMLDLSNKRDLLEQFNSLKKELDLYSARLSQRDFAIAITKCDIYDTKSVNKKVDEFLLSFGLKGERDNPLGFDSKYITYCQDDLVTNGDLPLFVAPISSVANINIEPLKFILYKGSNMANNGEKDEN